ncbi:hypothetical protein [Citrobacter koseri]|uniref:hypothetical protein n=1 Tax=Citrobacter koseri TaxID=545 RepID=UPI004039E590
MQRIIPAINKVNCKVSAILESHPGNADDIIYKLFRREGGGFVHVDTFRSFEDASKEAQEIIKNSAKLSWLANS